MKKLILSIFFVNLVLAGTYSETISDGQYGFYEKIDTAVKTNAKETIKQIDSMRNSIIDKIVKNDELKQDYLTKIKTLNTEGLLCTYEFDYEINKYLNLQNIEIQTETIKTKDKK